MSKDSGLYHHLNFRGQRKPAQDGRCCSDIHFPAKNSSVSLACTCVRMDGPEPCARGQRNSSQVVLPGSQALMGLIGSEPGASRPLRRMGKAQGWRAGDAQIGLLHICVQDHRLCVEYGVTQACLACDTPSFRGFSLSGFLFSLHYVLPPPLSRLG